MDDLKNDEKVINESIIPESILYGSFNLPKVIGKGEDADPLCVIKDGFVAISVFDGLGGAGSNVYRNPNDNEGKTGAAIASTAVKIFIENEFFSQKNINENEALDKILKEPVLLKNMIQKVLEKEKSIRTNNHKKSKLKSSLIRSFPTTIALQILINSETNVTCYSYWAGDSRNYSLTPQDGLQQLTVDHLTVEGDALENLSNDSRMSNFLSADGNFTIEQLKFSFQKPVIFISASDGCYDYLQTPMHFESLLIEEMKESVTANEWCEKIQFRLESIPAGDDCSMSFVAYGWRDFSQLKKSFIIREEDIKNQVVGINDLYLKLKEFQEKKEKLNEEIAEAESQITMAKKSRWEIYKDNYYRKKNNL